MYSWTPGEAPSERVLTHDSNPGELQHSKRILLRSDRMSRMINSLSRQMRSWRRGLAVGWVGLLLPLPEAGQPPKYLGHAFGGNHGLSSGNRVVSLAVASEGKVLASCGFLLDNSVRLWDMATGNNLATHVVNFSTSELLTRVALSPDGKTALVGTTREIHLWDVSSGTTRLLLRGPAHERWPLCFSPDGKRALWREHEEGTGEFRVREWDVGSGKRLVTLEG